MALLENSLKLIRILKNQGITKVNELAEMLNVDERMIRKYKANINKSGIAYIESRAGKEGGYYIDDVTLTSKDINALYEVLEVLNEYSYKDTEEFKNILKKIKYKFYDDF